MYLNKYCRPYSMVQYMLVVHVVSARQEKLKDGESKAACASHFYF